jgi:hypothetical protein
MKAYVWSIVSLCVLWGLCRPEPACAQGRLAAARAAADFVIEKFGGQAVREGVAAFASRIEGMAVRHGDEVFQAVRKCGPQFFKVVEEAGISNAGKAVRVMSVHGESGVAWVLKRPRAMSLFLKHGEEAAAVLVKHSGGIAEPLIERCGAPAIKALQEVGPQGGRRLAMLLSEGGELAQVGRTPELLNVVGRYGDRAMDFIFKHRFVLAGGATLGVFLANPEPFLSGARDITQIVAENAVKPIASIPGDVVKGTNWTLVFMFGLLVVIAAAVAVVAFLPWLRKFIGLWLSCRRGGWDLLLRAVPAFQIQAEPQSQAKNGKPQNAPLGNEHRS